MPKTIEAKPRAKLITKSEAIPKKSYLQYAGKEIDEDNLIERFKFEWCKEYRINEIKNFKIYYKIEDKKAYFVANGSVTIVIDFE
jgi:hypothetical protein